MPDYKQFIFYQIYPKSFCDSNGDGFGDLQGIRQKADYLQGLGVNAVWITPCFASPGVDNGYDISDYMQIDEKMGTMADMEALIASLHKRGIAVILDFVANHTSTAHEWFAKSRKSKDNPYRDYYIWRETPPNDWQSVFGGSAWQHDGQTGEYYLHSFAIEQADLNWENAKVRQEMCDVVDFWVKKGVDGFRIDVLDMISKDWAHNKNGNGPHLQAYTRQLFDRENTRKLFTVGECWSADIQTAKDFSDGGRYGLKCVFAFHHLCVEDGKFALKKPKLSTLCARISAWQTAMQAQGVLPTLFLENHDQPRSVSRFGNDENLRYESATLLGALVLLHRGIPFLYQGQEIGLTNNKGEKIEDFNDVESHIFYRQNEGELSKNERIARINYGGRDNARYMLPWTSKKQKSWTIPYYKAKEINVEKDARADKSVAEFYRQLIALRKKEKPLYDGDYVKIDLTEKCYIFERHSEDECIRVVCNFQEETPYAGKTGRILLNNYAQFDGILRPFQVLVCKL